MLSRHRCITRLSLLLVVVLHMAFATRLFSTMSSATKNKGDKEQPTVPLAATLSAQRARSPCCCCSIESLCPAAADRAAAHPALVCLAVRLRLSSSVVFPSRQSQSATLFFLHGLGDSARGGWSDVVPEVSGGASAAQRSAAQAVQCSAAQGIPARLSGPACAQSFFHEMKRTHRDAAEEEAEQRHWSTRTARRLALTPTAGVPCCCSVDQFQRRFPNLKVVLPDAPNQPVTLNGGMRMQSW